MTGVMPVDEGIHGFKWQVVTDFTLCFWRGNINSISLRGRHSLALSVTSASHSRSDAEGASVVGKNIIL